MISLQNFGINVILFICYCQIIFPTISLGCSTSSDYYILPTNFETRFQNRPNSQQLSCWDRLTKDELLESNSAISFYSVCPTENLSKLLFNFERSLFTLIKVLNETSVNNFKEIVFKQRQWTSIWANDNLFVSALNLLGEKKFCGKYFSFVGSLDLKKDDEALMFLYLLIRLSASTAVTMATSRWNEVNEFFINLSTSLSDRRAFDLKDFTSESAAKLLFYSYRNKLVLTNDPVSLSKPFKNNFPSFLAGSNPSVFDILNSDDIIDMIKQDGLDKGVGLLIRGNPAFGMKAFGVMFQKVSSNPKVSPSSKFILTNPKYSALFSSYVDPKDFPLIYDRDLQSETSLLKIKWPKMDANSCMKGFLFKRFFLLNTWEDSLSNSLENYPLEVVIPVMTSEQLSHSLAVMKNPADWMDRQKYEQMLACLDENKARILAEHELRYYEAGILPSLNAEKLQKLGALLPFSSWSVLLSEELSNQASKSFLCINSCQFCSTAQQSLMFEKFKLQFLSTNEKSCRVTKLETSVLQLIDEPTLKTHGKTEMPNRNMRRWQNLKLMESNDFKSHFGNSSATFDLLTLSQHIYGLRSLQSDFYSNLRKLEATLEIATEEDLQVNSGLILKVLRTSSNFFSTKDFSVDYLGVFGVQKLPVTLLVNTVPSEWPKDPRVCHEFFTKLGYWAKIEHEIWLRRRELVKHYQKYCTIEKSENFSEPDIIVLNKLACDISPEAISYLPKRAIIENLSLFGKCCLSPDQIEAIRNKLGSIKFWESYWLAELGDLTCELVPANDDLEYLVREIPALSLAEILSNQKRECNFRNTVELGYKKTGFQSVEKYQTCMKKIAAITLKKFEIQHYFLGWRNNSCQYPNVTKDRFLKTCAALMTIGDGIKFAEINEFEFLPDCEFEACVEYLSNQQHLTTEQKEYTFQRAIEIFRKDQKKLSLFLETNPKFVPLLRETEFQDFINGVDLDLTYRLITHVKSFTPNQGKYLVDHYEALIDQKWTNFHLSAMIPELICHVKLQNVEWNDLEKFIPLAREKIGDCIGTNFYNDYFSMYYERKKDETKGPYLLNQSDIAMLGNLISGMPKTSFITKFAIPEIVPNVLRLTPPDLLNRWVSQYSKIMTLEQMKMAVKTEKLTNRNLIMAVDLIGLIEVYNGSLYKTFEDSTPNIASSTEAAVSDETPDYDLENPLEDPKVQLQLIYVIMAAEPIKLSISYMFIFPCLVFWNFFF